MKFLQKYVLQFAVSFLFVLVPSTRMFAQSPCTLNTTDRTVTICTPTDGSTVSSSIHVVAGTTDSHTVTSMQIYLDGTKVYGTTGNALDTTISANYGAHYVAVQAIDDLGSFKATNTVTVNAPPPCTLNSTNRTVTICTPSNNQSVESPVRVLAGVTDTIPVTSMQVYLDGVKVLTVKANYVDTNLNLTTVGQHKIQVQAIDATGSFYSIVFVSLSAPPEPGSMQLIKHIIILHQENRSFDNYFGRLGDYRAAKGFTDSVDGVPLTKQVPDKKGHLISPYHFNTVCHESVSPGWNTSHYALNGGNMDGFMKAPTQIKSKIDPDNTRVMGYYDQRDLPYYYELATQYVTSDSFFGSVLAPTPPNREYIWAATSFGNITPTTPPPGGWTQPTIFDRMTGAGVSWRYYWQDPALKSITNWSTYQRNKDKVFDISQFYTDLQNESTLPSVLYIDRANSLDEHSPGNIQTGAANTKKLIDAFISSPAYMSSVFIFSYDEGGGLYDHVFPPAMVPPDNIPPNLQPGDPIAGFDQAGFRVPLIVVSPWVKPHYVSHVARDHTSILKLIETRFNVPGLTARDAAADNMLELFDFSAPNLATPPTLPAQPVNGACNFNLEKAPGH